MRKIAQEPVTYDERGRPIFRSQWQDDCGNIIDLNHAEPLGYEARVNKGGAVYEKTLTAIAEAIANILHGGQ